MPRPGSSPRRRGRDLATLEIGPEELLRKVPFFRDTPPGEFERLASWLRRCMIPDGETTVPISATH